ncbi:Small ubiquitin-related modifier OS=Caenorhabditis elegans GN=smo-1 PE=1 SV=1 [Rhizoctonia solani AG-1 IB]|uniref:Small ubiquitin-related modifier n=1 Tax=Thanatephorus cucumeris (strain AG1-IB / isolate 7/3/14) TaxID=1108050 RepID=A0A0B7FVE1_THACB|nr:Small ubiquitin-related modifier OS=Caenorhabditis elegans GN=smo-1 PE=1 SV=1 [Rhizoctonia solani AG-1 IB]
MSDGQPEGNIQAPSENDPISIKVVTSTGEEVYFKIKRNTKLKKLQGAYASKVGKDVNTFRFLYDGNRINDEDTPFSLDMENDDTIDVMVEQVGGGSV